MHQMIEENRLSSNHHYRFEDTLKASQKINWRIEDIIGGDKKLDFGKPFLPESLARVEGLTFLSPAEKRVLNQIRGNTYLRMFGIVEEFILPFLMDHLRDRLREDDYCVRAFLQFAAEEAKHIHLFKRFAEEFKAGFASPCAIIGPSEEIGKAVLAHDPLGVGLVILMIEWMTQSHYLDSIKDDTGLDPQFKSLLKHHWMEEAQHAKLDTLMVETLAERSTEEEIQKAIDAFLSIGGILDGGLKQQTAFDLESLERATGRVFSEEEKAIFLEVQHQANRWTYIGSGMGHVNFRTTLNKLSPAALQRIDEIAPVFC